MADIGARRIAFAKICRGLGRDGGDDVFAGFLVFEAARDRVAIGVFGVGIDEAGEQIVDDDAGGRPHRGAAATTRATGGGPCASGKRLQRSAHAFGRRGRLIQPPVPVRIRAQTIRNLFNFANR